MQHTLLARQTSSDTRTDAQHRWSTITGGHLAVGCRVQGGRDRDGARGSAFPASAGSQPLCRTGCGPRTETSLVFLALFKQFCQLTPCLVLLQPAWKYFSSGLQVSGVLTGSFSLYFPFQNSDNWWSRIKKKKKSGRHARLREKTIPHKKDDKRINVNPKTLM